MNVAPIQPPACEGCSFPTPYLTLVDPPPGFTPYRAAWLCRLCVHLPPVITSATTFFDDAAFPQLVAIVKAIALVGNAILDRLPPPFPDVATPPAEAPTEHVLADCGIDEPS